MSTVWLFGICSTILTFSLLLFLVRWIGKTQISNSTYFNWVAGACMGNISASIITSHNIQGFLLSATELIVFAGTTVLASLIALKSQTFRSVTSGLPIVLVSNGTIIYGNLKKSKVNKDLLKEMLREQGHFDYKKIRWAILEPTGILSVLTQDDQAQSQNKKTSTIQSKTKQKKNQPVE